ncbi:MAG: hypothetical protein HFJ59_04665 [Clostridia bacterium]|nr:hypothetical protein [Clostridia bacterium]
MKNFTFELNNKEINMRLISSDCEKIEKMSNCTLLDFVQQCSVTSIITLLQYMRAGTGESFTKNMAYSFYDELVDNGYTIATILDKLIYETLVVSGVISQEDLNNIREEREKINNMTPEEKAEMVKERKNAKK